MNRRQLYIYIKETDCNKNDLLCKLVEYVENVSPNTFLDIKPTLSSFVHQYKRKMTTVKREYTQFENKYATWLDAIISFKLIKAVTPEKNYGGRPETPFNKSSIRSKDRKVSNIIHMYSTNEILYAASRSLKKDGRNAEAISVKSILYTPQASLFSDKALALFLDANLSKATYQLLRNNALDLDSAIYPTYHDLKSAKDRCYPDDVIISDYSAEIPLQSLLQHTSQRLCDSQIEVLTADSLKIFKKLTLRSKIGFDGATGLSVYKQSSTDEAGRSLANEVSLFITCLVPLDLYFFTDAKRQLVWRNHKPSSPIFCRPVRFKYIKETKEVVLEEFESIKNDIKTLPVSKVIIAGQTLDVHHIIDITMIDGKVQTIISTATTSTPCCSVCGISPKFMNDLPIVLKKEVKNENLQNGISTLHAWIRLFECLLHIAYKIPIQKWQARGVDDKAIVATRKKKIQVAFQNEMGLVVDQPCSGGAGTSNDGNTARRVFQQAEKSAEIMGVSPVLIRRLHSILSVMSSGFDIEPNKFKKYCFETAELYTQLYIWYPMSQTLHKVLIHGHLVIEFFSLPLGMMSEEAQEASNKYFKKYRECFSRKCDRKKTNLDVFHRLLCHSDPFIAQYRKTNSTRKAILPADAIALLKEPSIICSL
ncbi:uncharacterized protein LOC136093881 [Hydra vulgaris]|uniref:uncharacterized protein LOC136093881 n=1 Tax=Hydra vulgaris TaxID=6087 RepID=UPI0032E9FD08